MKMVNRTIYSILLIGIMASSCQKERSFDAGSGGSGNSSIQGDWKLIGLTAKTEGILTGFEPGVGAIKTIAVSEYTSSDNAGTVKIEATKMTGNGLTYKINTVAKAYYYVNNVLEDSVEFPMAVQVPATNSAAQYKRIGSDSLYFEGGTFLMASIGSGVSQPVGAKIKFDGNKMSMRMNLSESKTIDTLGLKFNQVSKISAEVTLQRL